MVSIRYDEQAGALYMRKEKAAKTVSLEVLSGRIPY